MQLNEFGEDVFIMYKGEWVKNHRCTFEENESRGHANEAMSFSCMLYQRQ